VCTGRHLTCTFGTEYSLTSRAGGGISEYVAGKGRILVALVVVLSHVAVKPLSSP